jgi:ribosome-binding factor A
MAAEQKQRAARVAAQLRQEIARQVGRELGDPRLEGLIVASVSMTNDLRLARIFWRITTASTMSAKALDERKRDTEKALDKVTGRLRKAITARLGLRIAPELRFQYDEGQEARDRIDQLLEEVKKDAKA